MKSKASQSPGQNIPPFRHGWLLFALLLAMAQAGCHAAGTDACLSAPRARRAGPCWSRRVRYGLRFNGRPRTARKGGSSGWVEIRHRPCAIMVTATILHWERKLREPLDELSNPNLPDAKRPTSPFSGRNSYHPLLKVLAEAHLAISGEQALDNLAMHIGQPSIDAVVAEGELGVIDA